MATLSALLKKSTLDDHESILNASEDILKEQQSHQEAQLVKAIALSKLERYDEALKHFQTYDNLQTQLPEAYAYCLYKLGQFEEAVQVALAPKNSRGAQHVALQAAYRAEDWPTAIQAYTALTRNSDDNSTESFELRVNKLALDAEGLWLLELAPSNVGRPTTDDLASFETAYNAACMSIARGHLGEADMLLKRAINLCEHNEDLVEADRIQEVIPLKAQRVFVLQQLGKVEEAQALDKDVQHAVNGTEVDAITRKVIHNNSGVTSADLSNPFLAHKVLDSGTVHTTDKLFSNQDTRLRANARMVQLQTFRYAGLVRAAQRTSYTKSLPSLSSENLLTALFAAAAHARGEISKAAIRQVLPELEKRPTDVGLLVTLVQMYALVGNTTAAIDLMHNSFRQLEAANTEQDQDVRYSPGLVGLVVGLYRSQGRKSELQQELAKAARYWRNKSKAPSSLLRAAGIALLGSTQGEHDELAAEMFERLYEQEPKNQTTLTGYIASHARTHFEDANKLASQLTPVSELVSSIDIDALEQAGIPQSANALVIAQSGPSRKRAAASNSAEPKRKKRIRPSHTPKNYDPNVEPDPERWLPLRDRSYYRPKGKKKQKKNERTQGAGLVDETLDISTRPAGAGSEVVTGNGKNKKKKGKR